VGGNLGVTKPRYYSRGTGISQKKNLL